MADRDATRDGRSRRAPVRSAVIVAAALTLAGGALLAASRSAAAHSDTGTMGIEVTPTGPLTARVRVLLEYANDRDVAPGATVVAEATGPDGATVGPVPLADQGQGSYQADLTLPSPGDWTVTVTATNPAAEATAAVAVAPAATVGPGPSVATTASDGIGTSSTRASGAGAESSDDSGASPLLFVGIAVVALAAIAGGITLVRRR